MRHTEARGVRRSSLENPLCWLVLMLSLAATGCFSSGPALVSGRVVDAAVKGKLDEFRRQLAPEALSTIGTMQGMETIRQKLAHYTNISVGPALMISSKQGDQGYGHFGDVLQTFEATVAGSSLKGAPPEPVYTLLLQCQLSYNQYHHDEVSESCTTTIDENGVPWTNCTGGSPAYDSVDLDESCSITGIQDPQKNRGE